MQVKQAPLARGRWKRWTARDVRGGQKEEEDGQGEQGEQQ